MAPAPRPPPSAEAQAAKLRSILESAVTAIITIDDRGLIENINPATERLFAYDSAELIGQNVKILMPGPTRRSMIAISPTIKRPASRRLSALAAR